MKKRTLKRILWILVVAVIVATTVFAWPRLPIITAFASKGMCSSVFLAGKTPDQVMAQDLSFFPISLARCEVDHEEKSVTSTVLGIARRKALYREGLGSVIVLDTPEEELVSRSFRIPDPGYSQDTVPWPKGDLLPGSLVRGVDYERLDELTDTSFDISGEEPFKKTLGIAVVYRDTLLTEKYLGEYDPYTKFHGWSMTKSITGALAGILVDRGQLSLDTPARGLEPPTCSLRMSCSTG